MCAFMCVRICVVTCVCVYVCAYLCSYIVCVCACVCVFWEVCSEYRRISRTVQECEDNSKSPSSCSLGATLCVLNNLPPTVPGL